MAGEQSAEARIGYRGTAAFFGKPNALLPGQGTHVPPRQALKEIGYSSLIPNKKPLNPKREEGLFIFSAIG